MFNINVWHCTTFSAFFQDDGIIGLIRAHQKLWSNSEHLNTKTLQEGNENRAVNLFKFCFRASGECKQLPPSIWQLKPFIYLYCICGALGNRYKRVNLGAQSWTSWLWCCCFAYWWFRSLSRKTREEVKVKGRFQKRFSGFCRGGYPPPVH